MIRAGSGTSLACGGRPSLDIARGPPPMSTRLPVVVLLSALAACASQQSPPRPAPPLPKTGSAYEAAASIELPKREAIEQPGLHHVYRLSDRIVSGAEPEGEAAFEAIAAMGVKTILSVDGKAPDAATAAKYGLRYVHVPIRYKGIESEEMLAIAKTFREAEGPFFVHCFHGQHRGPAAAAVGRVVLDGAPREQAIAEMRQWCGTSKKYEGLYGAIAFGELPTPAATEGFGFDFAPAHGFKGTRAAMVEMSRSFETLEALAKNQWKPLTEHPDARSLGEAERTLRALEAVASSESLAGEPADYQGWMRESHDAAKSLVELLTRLEQGDAAAAAGAAEKVAYLKKRCDDCHKGYRN